MAVPTFLLSGSVLDLLDTDNDGDLDAVASGGGTLYLTPNTFGRYLKIDGQAQRPVPLAFPINSDGEINGGDPIALLANDPALDLRVPLQWRVKIVGVNQSAARAPTWWFEAPPAGEARTIGELVAVQGTEATGWTKGDPGPQGPTGTLTIGTVSTGSPGSSVVITNSGTPSAAVLDITIPRGEGGITNTGPDIHNSTAKTTPVDADEMGLVDSAASWALKRLTWANLKAGIKSYYDSVTATVTNKTMSGSSNTFSNIPATALLNTSTLVATTAAGSTGAEDGANTWAKLGSFTSSTNNWTYSALFGFCLDNSAVSVDTSNPQGILAVRLRNTSSVATAQVEVLAIGRGSNNMLQSDSFKVIYGAKGDPYELWVKKYGQYGQLSLYQLAVFQQSGWSVTWGSSAAWQSATPTGTVGNVTSTLAPDVPSVASTATAAGTTTLDITAVPTQVFTGSTTQTVKLPTTGVVAGQRYTIVNQSSGTVTVQSSGSNTVSTLTGGTLAAAVCIALQSAPTAATHWKVL